MTYEQEFLKDLKLGSKLRWQSTKWLFKRVRKFMRKIRMNALKKLRFVKSRLMLSYQFLLGNLPTIKRARDLRPTRRTFGQRNIDFLENMLN